MCVCGVRGEGVIKSVDQIYGYINELKREKKEFITNCYMDIESLKYLIKEQRLIYEYKEKCYLNLLYEENGFFRLYFWVADIEEFCIGKSSTITICDLFTKQQDEKARRIEERLCKCSFFQYACFEKWRAKSPKQLFEKGSSEFIYGYDKEPEAINMLYDIFDKYTDYLPCEGEMDAFLEEKRFINVYEKDNHNFIGSLIYSQRGREFTIDYYFVKPEERGKGKSYLLHDHLYQKYAVEGNKFVSWVNTENKGSILIHEKYNYQKMKLIKYTFLRNGD